MQFRLLNIFDSVFEISEGIKFGALIISVCQRRVCSKLTSWRPRTMASSSASAVARCSAPPLIRFCSPLLKQRLGECQKGQQCVGVLLEVTEPCRSLAVFSLLHCQIRGIVQGGQPRGDEEGGRGACTIACATNTSVETITAPGKATLWALQGIIATESPWSGELNNKVDVWVMEQKCAPIGPL